MMSLLCIVLALAAVAPCQATDCVFTLGGIDFDLSSLRGAADYLGSASDGSYLYGLNFCGDTVRSDCAGNVCQYLLGGGVQAVIGSWTKSPEPTWALVDPNDPYGGVTLTHVNGDYCASTRTTVVTFVCSSTTSSELTVDESSACQYATTFETPLVCEGGAPAGGLSNGSIFLIILTSCGVVYIAGGSWYKTKKKGTSGMESMPNIDFWRAFPGYVSVGCRVSYDWVKQKTSGQPPPTQYDEL